MRFLQLLQNSISKIFFLVLLVLTTLGCEAQQDALERAKAQGRDEGYTLGWDEGFKIGHKQGTAEGHVLGFKKGSLEGYIKGCAEGLAEGIKQGFEDGQKFFFKNSWLPTVAGGGLSFLFIMCLGIPLILFRKHYNRFWQAFQLYLKKRELKHFIENAGTLAVDSFSHSELQGIWDKITQAATVGITAKMDNVSAKLDASSNRIYLPYKDEINRIMARLIEIDTELKAILNVDKTSKFMDVFNAIESEMGLSAYDKIQLLEQIKTRFSQPS